MERIKDLGLNPSKIKDKYIREQIEKLLNIFEDIYKQKCDLKIENQRLQDENNHLKGEHAKPVFPAKRDISSTKERSKNQKEEKPKKEKKPKAQDRKIERQEPCKVDQSKLPADAIFKGYQTRVIPEIVLQVHYIEFKQEKFYSPSEKKTYIGSLPKGYKGHFSPSVRELVIILKHEIKTTESNIVRFLTSMGCEISSATVSRMLTQNLDGFHQEKEAIVQAGICSNYVQTDDTQAKVKGEKQHTHVLCNALFVAYFTEPKKDRLTVLDIMRLKKPRIYSITKETFFILSQMKVPQKRLKQLRLYEQEVVYNEKDFTLMLNKVFPDPQKLLSYQKRVREAAYISAYHQEDDCIRTLICDDAPQFKLLTEFLGLCWVHEGRHYKKLQPAIPYHQKQLDKFLRAFWEYYGQLLIFKEFPSHNLALKLEKAFDKLCSVKVTYADLEDRLAKTRANKEQLLTVLSQPDIPLHNNASELAVRSKVRDRDIRLHTMSDEGTKASDTFLTIIETAKKLNVNIHRYIKDRVSQAFELDSLAHVIKSRSQFCSGV